MTANQSSALRGQHAADPHRPIYHFLPPTGWMNDPNGLIQWHGEYHLFYQHNPTGPRWGNIVWGHAASDDLIHWRDLPVALAPTPGGPDRDGCWSGSAVNTGHIPALLYTGVSADEGGFVQAQCLATSTDNLYTWNKSAANPVIPAPPDGIDPTMFRDPYVWREGDTWKMVLGTGFAGVGGAALLYQSSDLQRWRYLGPLLVGSKTHTGEMWECPNFFPLGDKYVLIISIFPHVGTAYFVGMYDAAANTFTPERQGVVDYCRHFFAPLTMRDDAGRRIMFGWINETRPQEEIDAAGWAGLMSVPRLLTLGAENRLLFTPAPELKYLRRQHVHAEGITLTPDEPAVLPEPHGTALEIHAAMQPGSAARCGLVLFQSPDGANDLRLTWDRAAGEIQLGPERAPLDLNEDEPLSLHAYIDRSVVEVFANRHTCLTGRHYLPASAADDSTDSGGVGAFAEGGSAVLESLDVWQLAGIFRE